MPTWRRVLSGLRARPVEAALITLMTGWTVVAGLDAPDPRVAIAVGLVGVTVLALGRWLPLLALVGAFAGLFSLDLFSGGRALEDVFLAMVVWASFLVGRWARLVRQPWAAAAVLLLLWANVVQPGRDVVTADVVFPVVFTAAPWLLGLAVQLAARRADQATSYADVLLTTRHHDIRRASDEERLRIAHELHDVVAHNMSALSLQAQVARRRLEGGGEVTAADLTGMEDTARRAMNDLRRILGVLRPSEGMIDTRPSEGLDDVPALVEQCRNAGQDVRIASLGAPRPLPPALSLVGYRIIQEALSNARRHGGRGPVTVCLEWLDGRLVIRVSNPFSGDAVADPGRGRLGIAERVSLFGGAVTTEVRGGVWALETSLPTPAHPSEVMG